MPSLQEEYEKVVGQLAENSALAKSVKTQMEAEAANKGQSAERLCMAGAGPKLQEMNK